MSVDPRILQIEVEIDWDDGGFGGADDVVTDDIRNTPGLTIQRGKDTARPRAQPMIDSADVTLGNQDQRYTAANAGSPLYPFVAPDRPMRATMSVGTDATYEAALTYNDSSTYYNGIGSWPIFTGLTEEPQETRTLAGERHVQFRALGKMSLLKDVLVSTDLRDDIRTDEAIGEVLDAAGWPTADRVISVGDTTMNWWWLYQTDAWSALMTLLETEGAGASLYEDGRGLIHFENRNYRVINTRATVVQQTFDTEPAETNPGFVSYQYSHNIRDIYNDVSMPTIVSALIGFPMVWEYGETLTLGASQSLTLHIVTTDPMIEVEVPTVTTDYVVTSGSLSVFTATRYKANVIDIVITAGGGGVVLDGPGGSTRGPQVRAASLFTSYQELAAQTAAPVSIYTNRNRALDLNEAGVWPYISQPTAQALCDAAANYYSEGRPTISIVVMNRDAVRMNQMLQRDISDRIAIDAGANEFVGECWIEQLNYEIKDGGRVARLEMVTSRASLGPGYVESPALWDSGAWDEDVWGL